MARKRASQAADSRKKAKKPPSRLQLDLSAKLRALQKEMNKTDAEMAEMLHIGRTTWTNWANDENMPEEQAMVTLCQEGRVTMDWLYRGDPSRLLLGHAIRLTARLQGLDPEVASPEQMAAVAAGLATLRS